MKAPFFEMFVTVALVLGVPPLEAQVPYQGNAPAFLALLRAALKGWNEPPRFLPLPELLLWLTAAETEEGEMEVAEAAETEEEEMEVAEAVEMEEGVEMEVAAETAVEMEAAAPMAAAMGTGTVMRVMQPMILVSPLLPRLANPMLLAFLPTSPPTTLR